MEPREKETNCELNDAKGSEKQNDLVVDESYRHYEMIDMEEVSAGKSKDKTHQFEQGW